MKSKVLFLMGAFAIVAGADNRVDRLFENLGGAFGEYHQSTVLLQTDPKGEPKDLNLHDRASTASVKRLSRDRILIHTYNKNEGDNGNSDNAASSTVIERRGENVVLTNYNLSSPEQSLGVTASFADDEGTQLTFYQSDVKYLDGSPEAAAKRKEWLKKRTGQLGALVLILALTGEKVPAEVIQNEDWLNAFIVIKGAANPVTVGEILLDPLGKSARHPKGEPSLTILQVFHSNKD